MFSLSLKLSKIVLPLMCWYSFVLTRKYRNLVSKFKAAFRIIIYLQEKYEACIEDSTKALELNPHYLKALLRRAECHEKTEKLDEALEDYTKALEMDPSLLRVREACMVRVASVCHCSRLVKILVKFHVTGSGT